MKMICDVPDEVIKCIKDGTWCGSSVAEKMIANGIPLSSMEEPCEDCISRQAVLVGLANIAKAKARSDAQKALMGRVMFFTEKLPSVNPQKPKSEWEHDHEILKAYSDGASAVLDNIRAEIDGLLNDEDNSMYAHGVMDCLEIIDNYAEEDKA